MKGINIFFLSLFIWAASSCASISYDWIPPKGKTSADYNSDYADCRVQWMDEINKPDSPYLTPDPDDYRGPLGLMMANAHIDPGFANDCMEKKGWVRRERQ